MCSKTAILCDNELFCRLELTCISRISSRLKSHIIQLMSTCTRTHIRPLSCKPDIAPFQSRSHLRNIGGAPTVGDPSACCRNPVPQRFDVQIRRAVHFFLRSGKKSMLTGCVELTVPRAP